MPRRRWAADRNIDSPETAAGGVSFRDLWRTKRGSAHFCVCMCIINNRPRYGTVLCRDGRFGDLHLKMVKNDLALRGKVPKQQRLKRLKIVQIWFRRWNFNTNASTGHRAARMPAEFSRRVGRSILLTYLKSNGRADALQ